MFSKPDRQKHTQLRRVSCGESLTHSLSLYSLTLLFFLSRSEVPWLRTRRATELRVQQADRFPDRDHRGGAGCPASPDAFILLVLRPVFAAACHCKRRLHAGAVANPDPVSAQTSRPGGRFILHLLYLINRSLITSCSDPIFVFSLTRNLSSWRTGNFWNCSRSHLFKNQSHLHASW